MDYDAGWEVMNLLEFPMNYSRAASHMYLMLERPKGGSEYSLKGIETRGNEALKWAKDNFRRKIVQYKRWGI